MAASAHFDRNVSFSMAISGDERYIDVARAVVVKVAEHVGRRDGEAKAIGQAVNAAIASVVEHAFGGDPIQEIGLDVAAKGPSLHIRISYAGQTNGAAERGLKSRIDDTSEPDAIRQVVNRIEFGADSGREYCMLAAL